VYVLDLRTGTPLASIPGQVMAVNQVEGQLLAIIAKYANGEPHSLPSWRVPGATRTVEIWSLLDGKHMVRLNTVSQLAALGRIDRRPVAATYSDGLLSIWELPSGALLTALSPDAGPLQTMAMGEIDDQSAGSLQTMAMGEIDDQPVVLTASWEGVVQLWSLPSGALLATVSADAGPLGVTTLGEIDGRPMVISGSREGIVRLLDLRTYAYDAIDLGTSISRVALASEDVILVTTGRGLLAMQLSTDVI
jgi:WD40 repeat protein